MKNWQQILARYPHPPNLEREAVKTAYETLTNREKEVLVAFFQTFGNRKAMADGLGITDSTIRSHVESICNAFGLRGSYRSIQLMRLISEALLPMAAESRIKKIKPVDDRQIQDRPPNKSQPLRLVSDNTEIASPDPSPQPGLRLYQGTLESGMDPLVAYSKLEQLIDYNCELGYSFRVHEIYVNGDLRKAWIDPYTSEEFYQENQ